MRLRPAGEGDLWIGRAPSRAEIERRLGNDTEAHRVLFDWSMVEFVEHYFDDERLQSAYLGQGVIGTFASPHDPGTASIHFHHQSGRLGGMPGMWGYVDGGMGMVSFMLCDIARDAGRGRADRYSGGPDPAGDGRRARGRRTHRIALRGLERRSADDPASPGRSGRPRLARSRRGGAPGRMHRQAERGPARAAQLHRATGHTNAPSSGSDQHAAEQARMAVRLPGGSSRRAAGAALDRAVFPDGSRRERCARGRAQHERVRPVRAAYLRARRLGESPRRRSRTWRCGPSADSATTCRARSSTCRCSVRPTSSAKSDWSAATSSRANAFLPTCGTGGSHRGRPCPASSCAGRAPIRGGASSRSTAATRQWRSWGFRRGEGGDVPQDVGRCQGSLARSRRRTLRNRGISSRIPTRQNTDRFEKSETVRRRNRSKPWGK